MTTTHKLLIAIIIVIALYFGFVAGKTDAPTAPKATQAPQFTPIPVPTPTPKIESKMRVAIMYGCMEEGEASYEYCECATDYLIGKYGEFDIIQALLENETKTTEMVNEAVKECVDKL